MTRATLTDRLPIAASFHHLSRNQLIGTIVGLQLTLLLAALDQTIVTTAMPKIIASVNGFDRYAWVTTAYMLTSTAAIPILGKLSDMYGRKWILIGGAVFFVLTSALCGLAGEIPLLAGDGMNQLILFRGLQGIAGGTIMAMCFTVIGDIFPPAERGKYQGLFSAVFALASVIGPTLGGWITDTLSWRWVFYVNMPVGAIAVAVLWFAFPYIAPTKSKAAIDYGGVATLILFLVPLLLALTWVVDAGWSRPQVLALLAFSAVMFGLLISFEQRAAEPIIPLSLFRIPMIALSCMSLVFVGMGMFGSILFIPLFMQTVIGLSASKSGSLLTPMMLMITVGSITSGQLCSRTGRYKIVALTGLSLMTLGMILLASMGVRTTEMEAVRNMMIVGIGVGSLMPVYTLVVQNEAPSTMIGTATASSQFFRSIGGTLGTAVFGSIMMSRYLKHLNNSIPANTPTAVVDMLRNPMRAPVEATLSGMHQTAAVLSSHLIPSLVKLSLLSGIQSVFVIAAWLIGGTMLLNLYLQERPLRKTFDLERMQPIGD